MRSARIALLIVLLMPYPLSAAELELGNKPRESASAGTSGEKVIVPENTGLWQLYLKGGIVMHAILIASIAALAFGIERGIALRAQVQLPGGLVEESIARLSRGAAGSAAAMSPSPPTALSRLLDSAAERSAEGKEAMQEAVSVSSFEVLYELRKNVRPLGIVANVTPLMGLLGTVFGMIRAFDRVSAGGLGEAAEFAGGIAEALITTGAGLLVAIPSFLAYHFYRGRSEDLVRKAEAQAEAFIERATGNASSAAAPQASAPAPVQPGKAAT